MKERNRNMAERASKAHSDLNTFGAVIAILEGGSLYTMTGYNDAQRLITLCKKAMQKQLKNYDQWISKIGDSKQ